MSDEWKFPISTERLVAVLKYRGLDAEALLVAQQKNIKTFVEAQESFAKGIEKLVETQGGLVRTSVSRASEAIPELVRQRTLQGLAQAQLEYQREAAAAALTGLQEIAQLIWDQQRSALDLISRAFAPPATEDAAADADPPAKPPGT
jgi:hypothetical protein